MYLQGIYGSAPISHEYWKTLDWFYYPLCQKAQKDGLTLIDQEYVNPNVPYHTILNEFLSDSLTTGGLDNKSIGTMTAGSGEKYTVPFPLEQYQLARVPYLGEMYGVRVNRYPMGGDFARKSVAYAKSGTAVTEIATTVVPGVSAVLLADGFKDFAWIEIGHGNTRVNTTIEDVGCMHYDGPLENTCSYGKWFYYLRGTGVYVNLGKSIRGRNKFDAFRIVFTLAAMQTQTDGPIKKLYSSGSPPSSAEMDSPEKWDQFLQAADKQQEVIPHLMQRSCPGKFSDKISIYGPTDVEGWVRKDVLHLFGENPSEDQLKVYENPCVWSNGKPGYCKPPYQPWIAWFFADSALACCLGCNKNACGPKSEPCGLCKGAEDGVNMQVASWGALSPLVPTSITSSNMKLAWLLWACSQGYDFANPDDHRDEVKVRLKQGWGPWFSWAIAMMTNSMFYDEDAIQGFMALNGYTSCQLTCSGNFGGTLFEILWVGGTLVQDNFNPLHNSPCAKGVPVDFKGNPELSVFALCSHDGTCGKGSTCHAVINPAHSESSGCDLPKILSCTRGTNLGYPLAFPVPRQPCSQT